MKKKINPIISVVLTMAIIFGTVSLFGSLTVSAADAWDGTTVEEAPYNEETKTYTVSNGSQLAWIASQTASGNTFAGQTVLLENDIDLGGNTWTPIGKSLSTYFSGTFDGAKHTVSNFNCAVSINAANIVNAPYHGVGLFGICVGAYIKNLTVSDATVSISNESGYQNNYSSLDGTSVFAGGVCGYADSTNFETITVSNLSVSAYTGSEAGVSYVGGLCGFAKNTSDFTFCSSVSGSVSGKSDSASANAHAGGIVGYFDGDGIILKCYNTSSVAGGHSTAAAYTGGIAGKTAGGTATISSILDSYNSGSLSHSGSWLETGAVGGVAGYSNSTISRCYNSGSVTASTNTFGGDVYTCGIAGTGTSASSVSASASLGGTISGGTKKYVISSAGSKTNNLSLSSISGSPTKDANSTYVASEFYSASLFVSTLGWDFSSVWQSDEISYPTLQEAPDADAEYALLKEAVQALVIGFAEGEYYDKVLSNVILASESKGIPVEWSSANEAVVNSSTGVVTRQESDTLVKVTATLTYSSFTLQKVFVLGVVGTSASISAEKPYWGMSVEDARSLMTLVNGCKFKDVAADDPDVLVLTGVDTNEENVVNTVIKVMQFWEVPQETEYLREQLGDVIGLIEDGTDDAINDVVSDFSGGMVEYAGEEDGYEIKASEVASTLIKIPASANETSKTIYDNAQKLISLSIYSRTDDPVEDTLTVCQKLGSVFDTAVKSSGNTSYLGPIFSEVKSSLDVWKALGALKNEIQNAARVYIKQYISLRGNFESADDEIFTSLMEVHAITGIKPELENINQIAECLYMLQTKFCAPLDDEYRITIMCPVDVEVYDVNGVLVGRVTDNVVDTSIRNSLKITVGGENNDEKTVYIQGGDKYTFKLIGNDTGTMNISADFEGSTESRTSRFDDIELVNGKEMIAEVTLSDISTENFENIDIVVDGAISEENENVDTKELKYLLTIYETTLGLDGELQFTDDGGTVNDGYVFSNVIFSEFVEVNAGYEFSGFYTDAECTIPFEEPAMPPKAMTLYAKFVEIAEEFTVNWVVDGVSTQQIIKEYDAITKPANPSKEGYRFVGWTPVIPEKMPSHNMTFTAVFRQVADKSAEVNIKEPITRTVKYGETINLYASVKNLPEGAKIKWRVVEGKGVLLDPSFTGAYCSVTSKSSGDVVIEAYAVDSHGNVLTDSDGNRIYDREGVHSEVNLWLMIVSFFKNLFDINRTIAQAFKTIY